MAQNWYEAPEVAPQPSLPEVYYPAPALAAPYHRREENFSSIPLHPYKTFNDTATLIESPKSSHPGANSIRNYDTQSTRGVLPPTEHPREASRRFCGCSVLVLVLSALIAVLSIAVIGLAAGTGIQANRANNAESRLAIRPNSTNIDRGCSTNPDSISATQYTSAFFNRQTFKIFCNSDAPNPPLQSLFVGNFDDCIDACAFYSAYTAGNFPDVSNSANVTCSGVSFIPEWTNRTTAQGLNAPGNCYLKPGPQNSTALTHGTAVHAAIIQE